MFTVLRRDFKELRQTNAFRILVIVSAVIAIGGTVGGSLLLGRQSWLGEPAGRPWVELIIGLITYFLPLVVLLAFIWAFASLPVTREKVNGNIECLLATPLSPAELWAGKGLAIFLPGFIISAIANLIVLLGFNFLAIIPAAGAFILPGPVLLIGFFINPLLFYGLLSFILLFSLANNPDIAFAPSFIIGFGLMIGIPVGVATGVINVVSWQFALWYLAGAVAVWLAVAYLSRRLTKENIVLSSKGD
jgi:ABC-type transport system involved in multi-copper enzyme maturation permease subunit